MENKVLLRINEYALIETENNYIVASGYDNSREWGQQWEHGTYFMKHEGFLQALSLLNAIECFYKKVKPDFITRDRLIELATRFKDVVNEDEDMEYVLQEMDDYELEFFGLDDLEED